MTTLSPIQAVSIQGRCTLQSQEIGSETVALRCLNWDRDRFDIEFGLDSGTTYNSFIVKGEKTALIDNSHLKFQDLYPDTLTNHLDLTTLDYLIVSHTEPDHSGLVKEILDLTPHVTVVGAKVAIQFLENMVHQPFKSQVVKQGDFLDLGNGHELTFISAPNLHWPDTILTYDPKTRILFNRAIESLLQVGDLFVLNILEEGNVQHYNAAFSQTLFPWSRSLCWGQDLSRQ